MTDTRPTRPPLKPTRVIETNAAAYKKAVTEFINEWPLHTPFVIGFTAPATSFAQSMPPTILRYCESCDASPTWALGHPIDAFASAGHSPVLEVGIGNITAYRCTNCGTKTIRVWYHTSFQHSKTDDGKIVVTAVEFRKSGQSPAFAISPDPEVEKGLLASSVQLFKKGLTCISVGYGLGAVSYFRRVVEDEANSIIELFAGKATDEGEAEAAAAIRAAGKSHHVEDRLKAAADVLPASLRPGNLNPLQVLYDNYSVGIHRLSDDECLAVAQHLKDIISYVFSEWKKHLEKATSFRTAIQGWTRVPRAEATAPDGGKES